MINQSLNSKEKYNNNHINNSIFDKNENKPSIRNENIENNKKSKFENKVEIDFTEIPININEYDISNINREKNCDKQDISKSSGDYIKLFTGNNNEIIDILNEKLTEKERQNKVLIQEIEKLKGNQLT